ncbi:MAG: diacylglycerol kinase family lipid kinase [Dehalococcoidia bacterium]|nr:MAG: diacylglycerol kinase family lipid kinase [Dehalococcoidia bacterium]
MTLSRAKVIINPVAGGGSIRRHWPHIYTHLRDTGLSFDYEFTRGPGHAIEIAKRAIDADYRYLIAAGGDGTINEVANGILRSTNSSDVTLGMFSTGTASSFARSLGITQDYASLLVNRKTISIDVGMVECWNQGRRLQRFFVNEASAGFGAAIVNAWSRLPKLFGHSINYRLRTITGYSALVAHRNRWIRLVVGNKHENFLGCYVVVANGQYFAGGMQIAPHARLDDGLLNLVTVGDVSKSELLRIVPTVYDGSHIGHPKIKERKVTVVTIESDERLLVEADGEILGEAPASFSVMPSALTVVV